MEILRTCFRPLLSFFWVIIVLLYFERSCVSLVNYYFYIPQNHGWSGKKIQPIAFLCNVYSTTFCICFILPYLNRWARLLKQQLVITFHHLPAKENFRFPFLFAPTKWKFSVSSIFSVRGVYVFVCIYIYIYIYLLFIFMSLFIFIFIVIFIFIIICCHPTENEKRKPMGFSLIRWPFAHRTNRFVVCPFVDEETKGTYPFANGLIGLNLLNRLAHLCVFENLNKY